jgi:cytochrome c peroxidase
MSKSNQEDDKEFRSRLSQLTATNSSGRTVLPAMPNPFLPPATTPTTACPPDPTLMDTGRMRISQNPADSLKFKIPTLRNIEVSFTYMHDRRFKKLEESLQHYVAGIEASPTLAKELRGGIELTEEQQQDIIAFLLTLTDRDFLYNPKYGFPRF